MFNPYKSVKNPEVLGATSIFAVVVLWSILSGFDVIATNKLPAPWEVAKAFIHLAWDSDKQTSLLLDATLWSLGRVVGASLVVFTIGIPVGILMGASPKVNAFISPLVDPFRSAPVVAILPILVMLLGIGELMKITFLVLGAIVFLIPMVRDAVRDVPPAYWTAAYDLGATPFEAVRKAVVPMAKPRIADAMITAVSIMWTYISVAEMVNSTKGLGQLIQNARRFSALDQVAAGIFVIIALALIVYNLMIWTKNRLYPWAKE